MAKKKFSSFNLDVVGSEVVSLVSMKYKQLEKFFDNIEEPLDKAFKLATKGLSEDMKNFVSPSNHYRSGDTLKSFDDGKLTFDASNDWFSMRLGFDTKKGGWPALILEYGDSGSPMRMPNKAHFFIYKAQKTHDVAHGMSAEIDNIMYDYIEGMVKKKG